MGKCPYCNESAGIFKKIHRECELKNKEAKKIITEKSIRYFEDLDKLDFKELKSLAQNSYLTEIEYNDLISCSYSKILDNYLDDGILSKEEEDKLEKYIEKSELHQEVFDKNDSLSKTVRASILRDLLNGEEIKNHLKITLYISHFVPFI